MATTFATDLRAASIEMLRGYRDAVKVTDPDYVLNVWEARPSSINPPIAFFDRIRERFTDAGPFIQRTPQALVLVLHGLWDGKDTAQQRDRFVDGFLEYARTRYHDAGGNTLLELRAAEDIPYFVPEWIVSARQFQRDDLQRAYYATQLTLEGYAET